MNCNSWDSTQTGRDNRPHRCAVCLLVYKRPNDLTRNLFEMKMSWQLIHSFVISSVLGRVHSFFHSEVRRECHLVLPVPDSSIFSFPLISYSSCLRRFFFLVPYYLQQNFYVSLTVQHLSIFILVINPLAPELFFFILAHPVYKM